MTGGTGSAIYLGRLGLNNSSTTYCTGCKTRTFGTPRSRSPYFSATHFPAILGEKHSQTDFEELHITSFKRPSPPRLNKYTSMKFPALPGRDQMASILYHESYCRVQANQTTDFAEFHGDDHIYLVQTVQALRTHRRMSGCLHGHHVNKGPPNGIRMI